MSANSSLLKEIGQGCGGGEGIGDRDKGGEVVGLLEVVFCTGMGIPVGLAQV